MVERKTPKIHTQLSSPHCEAQNVSYYFSLQKGRGKYTPGGFLYDPSLRKIGFEYSNNMYV